MYCNACNTDKSENDFYTSNKTKCKECVKECVKKRRSEKIDSIREYDRTRNSLPHRVMAREQYRKTEAYARSHEMAVKRWSENYPARLKATHMVSNAVRDGRLKKQPCWVCGGNAQAHHPDYDRPLDVVWLCPPHHRQAHAIAKNLTKSTPYQITSERITP